MGRSIPERLLAAGFGFALALGSGPRPAVLEVRPHRVRIAAAADLQFALDEVASAYRKSHPHVELTTTFGSSGNFFAQLSQKAPYDLFLSADADYPRRLLEAGLAVPGSDFRYARGRLALWVRSESKIDLEKRGIDVLLDPMIRTVAIANPRHAPYGRAAEAALKSAGIFDRVRERLIFGENIAETAHFVETGAADAGLIALSLAEAPAMRGKGRFWVVPAAFHPPIEQAGAILAWAEDPAAARAFRDFLTAEAGRAILARYGFDPPAR